MEEPDLLCDQEREILSTRQIKNQARKNSEFDDKGVHRQQDGEMGKRRRPRKQKWQNTHLEIDFSQNY